VGAGIPLAVEPGGIAADHAAEPSAAISNRRLILVLSFATLNSHYALFCQPSTDKSVNVQFFRRNVNCGTEIQRRNLGLGGAGKKMIAQRRRGRRAEPRRGSF